MRIEPPPSLPWLNGLIPAAVSAEAPPDEPPGECFRFHGLRVVPCRGESVRAFQPNSEVVVLPRRTRPAAWKRSTMGAFSTAARIIRGLRAVAGRPSLYRRRVLDRGRHAVERRQGLAFQPARLRGLGRRPGAVTVDQDKSIERRLQFRCTLYHRVDSIDGGKDLARIKCCEFRCGNPGRRVIRHAFFVSFRDCAVAPN